MFLAQGLTAHGQGLVQHRLDVTVPAEVEEQQSKPVQGRGDVRMLRPEDPLANVQRAAVQRFGLGEFAQVAVQLGQHAQRRSQVRVFRPERLLQTRRHRVVQRQQK